MVLRVTEHVFYVYILPNNSDIVKSRNVTA